LGERFATMVMLSGHEDNRSWATDAGTNPFRVSVAKGWTVRWAIPRAGRGPEDVRYTHITPGYLWALVRFRPDAIISTEMGGRSLISLVYGRLARVPVWVWWGGTIHTERDRSRLKRAIRRHLFVRAVDRWISYGASSTAYLRSVGVPPSRVLQIQNAVDAALYPAEGERRSLASPHPRVLFVGQLIGRKGIFELLDVAAQTQREGTPFSLVIVGDGPSRRPVEEEVRRSGLRSVEMLGNVPYGDMASIYRACDLLVFPTLDDVWGLVVNEALHSGLPVIASEYAGCAEELLPAPRLFDPLDRQRFLDVFRRALRGELPSVDPGTMMSIERVADLIAQDVTCRIRPPALRSRRGTR